MGEVVRFRKPAPAVRHKGKTLCRHGRHKWVIDQEQRFDVKQGKLVTLSRCERCGAIRTDLR